MIKNQVFNKTDIPINQITNHVKGILFSFLLIPFILFGQDKSSGSTKWYRVMGDQLEINTQYEIKKIAKENNIPFESFINKYGFSKEEPLMYFLSGDEIVSITWWAVATLTTVGYGDVFPITGGGKLFASFVVYVGLGFVALPAGLIGGAFSEAFSKKNQENS